MWVSLVRVMLCLKIYSPGFECIPELAELCSLCFLVLFCCEWRKERSRNCEQKKVFRVKEGKEIVKRRELKERREQNLLPAYSLVISLCYSLRKNISISCRMFRKRYRIGHDDDRVMEVKKWWHKVLNISKYSEDKH